VDELVCPRRGLQLSPIFELSNTGKNIFSRNEELKFNSSWLSA